MTSRSMVLLVAERMGRHPPFDGLGSERREEIARRVAVRYVEKDERIFAAGEPVCDEIYVVHRGRVAITQELDGRIVPLDEADEGDVFGARALLLRTPYAATATAKEDSLIYVLPGDVFRDLFEHEPNVARFFAAGFAADIGDERGRWRTTAEEAGRTLRGIASYADDSALVDVSEDVVVCGPGATVRDAAERMARRDVGSIFVVDDDRRPLGIVTDTDLRRKVVATSADPEHLTVREIMSAPVIAIPRKTSVSMLIRRIMKHRVHHFAVTSDGTDRTGLIGVVSEHDILRTQGGHPTTLLTQVSRATTPAELRKIRDRTEGLLARYLEQEAAMSFVAAVVEAIDDAIVKRAVEWAEAALGAPPVPYVWLALGSEGRRERLLRTDQDNAMLYADGADEKARAYFDDLAGRVVQTIVDAGFRRCPGDVMATNPKWRLSGSAWRSTFDDWITRPDRNALLHANIFFDFRPVAGDFGLADDLFRRVASAAKRDRGFLAFFAHAACTTPPPLTFFRSFMVERSGDHRDRFDVKARAMAPLADMARVLAFDLGVAPYGSTPERLIRAAEADASSSDLLYDAASAYEVLMRIRAREGLRTKGSGRYIEIDGLSKIERQMLRGVFGIVEDLRRHLTLRYRLEMFR